MFVETKKEGEAPVKQEPSLRGFIAWLETKNAAQRYDYYNCNGGCLVGQYVNSIGMRWSPYDQGGTGFGPGRDWWYTAPEAEPLCDISAGWPHTFGAALERALALSV
jgi:hypothetical protein